MERVPVGRGNSVECTVCGGKRLVVRCLFCPETFCILHFVEHLTTCASKKIEEEKR